MFIKGEGWMSVFSVSWLQKPRSDYDIRLIYFLRYMLCDAVKQQAGTIPHPIVHRVSSI